MKKLIALLIVGAIGWQAYGKYLRQNVEQLAEPPVQQRVAVNQPPVAIAPGYRCDGRTHCSQMTSCQEATWFLKNCPDTKMDGNNDGIPCEKQWCN
ncbi:MAG: excalibur calcium-binding domain-containing protein [Dechloromonas sp.]|nr:excalibur calcium-binding domain-containing protein [Dechloromonas sp.]